MNILADEQKKLYDKNTTKEELEKLKKELTGYSSIDEPWMINYQHNAREIALDMEKGKNISTIILDSFEKNKDVDALRYFNRKISRDELKEQVEIWAKSFRCLGVEEKEVVPLYGTFFPDVCAMILALNQIGAAIYPVKLNISKKDLEKETKKNKEIINQMQDHFKSTMIKADISLIDQNEGLLINKDINFMKFYDVIIDIKSIQDITKGWDVKMSERAEKEYENFKKGKIIKIGVIGNSNKGKSFLLSKISKIKLPSGTSIRTEGLSIKYPELDEYKNRKIALLDSCGLESPILIEDNFKGKDINEEKKKENNKEDKKDDNIINNEEDKIKDVNEDDIKEEKNEENNKEENNIEEDNEEKLKLEKEELNEKKDIIKQNDKIKINGKVEINSKELFKIKSREKLITELFLQNYIIYNSDILIIVVGILTYSEQKLLHRIKIEIQKSKLNKQIYVIHNLMTYTSLKQIEEYINDYLLKKFNF